MVLQARGLDEDLAAMLATVRRRALVNGLLVTAQEDGLAEVLAAKGAHVSLLVARVRPQLVWVGVAFIAVVTREELGFHLHLAAFATCCLFRTDDLGDGGNFGFGGVSPWPRTGKPRGCRLRRLLDGIGVILLSDILRVTGADVQLQEVHSRKGERTLAATKGQLAGRVARHRAPCAPHAVALQVAGKVTALTKAPLAQAAHIRANLIMHQCLVLLEERFVTDTFAAL